MISHEEFHNAGKVPGLQIWRIEKMDLKPVPKKLYGNFFIGDAYILLHTSKPQSYNLHKWLGSECTQDESAAAAIFATQLDQHFNDKPRQFREIQGEESITFRSYFKSGIIYQKGGVSSGFKHVVTNEMNKKRLLHVKGRQSIRAIEVDMDWSSFNKGDCFIIDLGNVIYHWAGSECNPYERLRATKVAIDIRDNERAGGAKMEMIVEGEEPKAVIDVLGPAPANIAPATSDKPSMDVANRKNASLYMISDAAGSMKSTLVAEKSPFKQEMLASSECYILDNSKNNKIYLWKGKEANKAERDAAMSAAEQYAKKKNYSNSVQIVVLPGGAETALFKEFFPDWKDKYETTGPSQAYIMGQIARVEQIPFDASTLHCNNTMAAQHGMVDDGSGTFEVWRIEEGKQVPVDPDTYGHFYGGDCYLILYSYSMDCKKKHIIYIWQGLKSTQDERGASAFLAVQLDDKMGKSPAQVLVTQSEEPSHLMSIFKKKPMIIHLGGTSRKGGQTQAGNTRLFHIRRSTTGATRAVEVEPSAEFLNTNDVFVLKTPDSLFCWKGVGSTEEEMTAAKNVASFLGGKVMDVREEHEPDGFWTALGGKKAYQTSTALQKAVKPIRLFGCSNKTGRLIAEEVPGEISQSDLATDDVMLLDTWDQLFIWIGKDANEVEKKGSGKIAKEYIDSDPSGRSGTPLITINQGFEPPTFCGWFQAWDPKMW